jgi:NAD(P)-dependent dehydrogenase (short-subunit alcohol dehydrogenase family)
VALVTGATKGIGQATAVLLAAEGAIVGVNQRPGGDARETLRLIEEAGGEGFPVVEDMRDPEAVRAMVLETARRGGRIDHIVSNAAINPFLTWDATSFEDFDRLFETNVHGTWIVCTEGARQMVRERHGGSIAFLLSDAASYITSATLLADAGFIVNAEL